RWRALVAGRLHSCGGTKADTSITIHRLIIHKVDHKNSMAPLCTDLLIQITDDVHNFFARQITESRDNKNARSGAFVAAVEGQPSVPDLCADLVGDIDTFIAQSKVLAAHLFDCIKG